MKKYLFQSKINSFMTEAVIASVDWFLYDNGLRHEKVKKISEKSLNCSNGINETFH